jgi:hypothetical protein
MARRSAGHDSWEVLRTILPSIVMAGFMPATHTHNCKTESMGRRDKPGDDGKF